MSHKKEKDFAQISNLLSGGNNNFESATNLKSLGEKPFIDEYITENQKERDRIITRLLDQYVEGYKIKNESNKCYKKILFFLCIFSIFVFVIGFVIIMIKINYKNTNSITSIIQLISTCITFLSLIIGILKIITEYVFPKDEEAYITKIVELIQKNDLDNKKENIKINKENKDQDN